MVNKNIMLLIILNLCCLPAFAYTGNNAQSMKTHHEAVGESKASLEKQVASLEARVAELEKPQNKKSTSPVTIAPYLGVDAVAVVTLPSYNEDVRLLKQNQRLQNDAIAIQTENRAVIDRPLLEVSGKIEGQAYIQHKSSSGHGSSIEMSSAELDLAAHLNQLLTGLITFGYDKNAGYPVNTSSNRVFIDQAFITLGNFNQSPFYGTLGQKYVPFGQYNNFMISAPLTQSIGRVRSEAMQVGYQHFGSAGLYGSLYTFKGFTKSTASNSNVDRGGISLGYEDKNDFSDIELGVDAISNIADAQGIQATGASDFGGFGIGSSNEYLAKRVPGIDIHGRYYRKPMTFLAEYTGAISHFNENNLSFNGHGAQPKAADFQMGYSFNAWDRVSSLAIGYGQSWQALALNIPQQRFTATFNTTPWKNTIASVEFLHAVNYSNSDTASGQNFVIYPRTSHYSNQLTAKFGLYF